MFHFPILSFLIWWPMLGAVLVLITGEAKQGLVTKVTAVAVSLIELAACVPLYRQFDVSAWQMQFTEAHDWIPTFGVHYALGIDGLSLVLIILAAITTLVVTYTGCKLVKTHVPQYMACFLVCQGMMVGVFAALDVILFYVFWEGMLVPMYISIGIWGGANRSYAAIKFFIYTFVGSVFMLVAFLYLHTLTGSFMLSDYYGLSLPGHADLWLFLAFFLAFAVKVPMWPLHTWLPDAHTEAPAGGSVVLAALMLKMGVYGFLRISMPIAFINNQGHGLVMIILSLVAIVYIGILAIAQVDMKKLIAYSSIAHMGFCILGCYLVYDIILKTGNYQDALMSMEGAVFQMISHAFSSGALFLAVGIMQYAVGSRLIKDFGGVAKSMPILAAFFMLFSMANVGLPGTSGFVGEFMVIMSAFKTSPTVAFLAATSVVISAAYTLWMYKRVFFGEVVHEKVAMLQDIGWFNIIIFALLGACVIFLGLYPEWLLRLIHASIEHLLSQELHLIPGSPL